ncbi:MAG: hypothetical protein AAFN50_04505, partial [Pseudomonadota bacterium]
HEGPERSLVASRVQFNNGVVEAIFEDARQTRRPGSDHSGTPPIYVDDAVGVGTAILLNFFDDAKIETVVDKTASGSAAHGVSYQYFSLQLKKSSLREHLVSVNITRDSTDAQHVVFDYGRTYKFPNYYSLQRLPGTTFHVLIERSRAPNYNVGSIIRPSVSARGPLPIQLTSSGTGVIAEFGPVIGYGLAGFSFGDEEVGYAISNSANAGHPPQAFKTLDGGASWQDLPVSADWVPRGIHFRTRTEGYLILRFNPVGHSMQNIRGCGLLRTVDGGQVWEEVKTSECDCFLGPMNFSRDDVGYAYVWSKRSQSGWLWRSIDGGRSWSSWIELPKSQAGVSRIEVIDDDVILVPQLGVFPLSTGILVVSANGQLRNPIHLNYPRVKQLRFASRDIIFAVVSDELGNYLLRTVDGGRTWTRVLEGSVGLAYVTSRDEIGVLVSKGRTDKSDIASPVSSFAYTADGGNTWIEGPTTDLSPYLRDNFQKLNDGTELNLTDHALLSVRLEE